MPTIKKRTTKSLKEPQEEIKNAVHHATDMYQKNPQQFAFGAIALVVLLVVAGGYLWVRSANEKKAARQLSIAFELYKPAGGEAASYQKALENFQEIRKTYKSTISGAIAQYYIGNALVNLGRNDDALREYQSFVSQYAGEKTILGLVYQRMGYIYLSQDKKDEAVKSFEQSEKLVGTGAATFELARYFDKAGNMGEAMAKYKDIAEKLPGTSWAMEARLKLPPPNISATPVSRPAATAAPLK